MTLRSKAVLYFMLVFFTGAITSSIFEWLAPITTIQVTNASSKVIQSLKISYSGMGEHEGHLIEGLKPGQRVTFKWTTDGKASYRLHATFEDGTQIKGGAGYTQRGNTVKEAIGAERVMSSLPLDLTFGLKHSEPRDTTSPAGD